MFKDLKTQKEEDVCEECGGLKQGECQCDSDSKESDGLISDEEELDEKSDEW